MDIVLAYENWFTVVRVVVIVEKFWLETPGAIRESGIIKNSRKAMRFANIDQIYDLSCTELAIVYVGIYTALTCNVIHHTIINHLPNSRPTLKAFRGHWET